MTLYIVQTRDDGSQVISDNTDPTFEVVLKPGQFKAGMTREQAEALRDENSTAGENPRSETDEQARETAENAATGEAHEQAEEAK